MLETVKNFIKDQRKKGRGERKRFGALDDQGGEKLDSTPMQPPIGYNPAPSMFDVMRKMIADHHVKLANEGMETPEEADDFEVEDDFDPRSPYEHNFDPPAVEFIGRDAGKEKTEKPVAEGDTTPARPGAAAGGSLGSPTVPRRKTKLIEVEDDTPDT